MKKRRAAWAVAAGVFVWAVWHGTHRPTAPAPFTFQGTVGAERLSLSPNGTLLAEASRAGQVAVFDTANGKRKYALTVRAAKMTFSQDSRLLLTVSRGGPPAKNGAVQIWSAATGVPLSRFVVPMGPPGISSSAKPRVVALSADLRWAAVRDAAHCTVYDLTSGRQVKALLAPPSVPNSVSFSHDGSSLAVGSDSGSGGLWLWGTKTWHPLSVPDPSIGPIHSVRFSVDGTRVAALGPTDLSWWNVRPWKRLGKLAIHSPPGVEASSVNFSSDGRHLLVTRMGTSDSVAVVDCVTGRETMTLPDQLIGHASLSGNRVQTIRVLPTRIVSVAQLVLFRQTYSILDMDRQQEIYRVSVPAGPKSAEASTLGADFQPHESDFSADGHVFAAGGYDDGILHVWRLP